MLQAQNLSRNGAGGEGKSYRGGCKGQEGTHNVILGPLHCAS